VPAAAAAAIGYGAIRLALLAARRHLLPTSTRYGAIRVDPPLPSGGWYLGDGYLTSTGERLPAGSAFCLRPAAGVDCFAQRHITANYIDYLPAHDLLWLRLIEGGSCVALAAAIVLLSFWLLRRITS
jgi:hypothetical protein